jgi:hypothetical protein
MNSASIDLFDQHIRTSANLPDFVPIRNGEASIFCAGLVAVLNFFLRSFGVGAPSEWDTERLGCPASRVEKKPMRREKWSVTGTRAAHVISGTKDFSARPNDDRMSFGWGGTCGYLNKAARSAIGRNNFIGWSANDKKPSRR